MNHRIPALSRPALALAALLAAAAFTSPAAHAGDTARLDLLASAGSLKAMKTHDRHGHRGYRDPRGHRGRDRRRHWHDGHGHDSGHFIRERAHRYAATAVRQAREARSLGYYSDHPRWRTGYQRHYRWALQASPHRIEEETRRRARKLRELRTWGHGFPSWADHRHGPHCRH